MYLLDIEHSDTVYFPFLLYIEYQESFDDTKWTRVSSCQPKLEYLLRPKSLLNEFMYFTKHHFDVNANYYQFLC